MEGKKKIKKYNTKLIHTYIYIGYGTTETTGLSFYPSIKDPVVGHVGAVTKSMEFKLVDVPELNYTSEDKDSEGNL